MAGNKSERAQLYASTLTDAALGSVNEDAAGLTVYTVGGQYAGHDIPQAQGVYILKKGNKQPTIIIN